MTTPGRAAFVAACFVLAPSSFVLAETPASFGAAGAEPAAVRVRFDDRPVIELGSAVRVELGGRVDADIVNRRQAGNDGAVTWGDCRVEAAGDVASRVRFELSGELCAGAAPSWRDAFVDVRASDELSLRAGRFKVPFSEERTRSAGRLDFVRRSLVTRVLAPGRDVGATVRGRMFDRRLAIEAGVFEGRWSEWLDEDDLETRERHLLVAARVTARPFHRRQGPQHPLGSLRFGGSWLRSRAEGGEPGFRVRAFSRDTLLEALPVGGTRSGLGLEGQWELGPVRLAGEWIQMSDERRGQAIDGGTLRPIDARGWYGSAVWRVLSPRKDVAGHRWLRALDFAARVESLSVGTGGLVPAGAIVHPRAPDIPWHTLRVATIGATLSVTRWARVQANLLLEDAAGPSAPVEPAGRWGSQVRFQIAF
jgi:phosphate-selective porin